MNNSIFTLLELIPDNPYIIHTTGRWRTQQGEGKIYCPACGELYRRRFPQPIDIVLSQIPDGTIGGGVFYTPLSVFHRAFIEQIRAYIPETEFSVGRCFYAEGGLMEDYVTCYSRNILIVHGGLGTQYEACSFCGSIQRRKCTRPDNIPRKYLTDAHIYMDRNCRFFFDEALALQLDLSAWPGIKFEAYPVEDNVLDGDGFPIDT